MAKQQIESLPKKEKTALTENQTRYLIAASIALFTAIFYLSQNLFYVNNLNDFGEYFIRAEQWLNGQFHWYWGMDKLLTIIELVPLSLYPHDFFDLYRNLQINIIILSSVVIFFFLIKKSDVLPEFRIRALIVLFLITMPFFAFKTIVVDQSQLFTVMLLLFLTTYNNKYLGFMSLLVYIARPESLIIFPLYVVLFFIDKNNRKKILINFISFAILLSVYLYLVVNVLYPGSSIATGYSVEQGIPVLETIINTSVNETIINTGFFSNVLSFLKHGFLMLIKSPVIATVFAMVITQNYLLILFFILGLLFSINDKRMYVFYMFILGYVFLLFVYQGFQSWFPAQEAWTKYKDILHLSNKNIEIVNGRNMDLHLFGHSRYRLFLYPAIAAFIIAGIWHTFYFIQKLTIPKISVPQTKLQNTPYQKFKDFFNINTQKFPQLQFNFRVIAIALIAIFILNNFKAYKGFSKEFKTKAQLNDVYMTDLYHAALKIRETSNYNNTVFIPFVCNSNLSFINEFEVFSGTRYLLMPVCDSVPPWYMINHPQKLSYLTSDSVAVYSPTKFVYFDHLGLDFQKSFNKPTQQYLDSLIRGFKLNYLDSLNIKYVIVNQELKHENLELIYTKNQTLLYLNKSMSGK